MLLIADSGSTKTHWCLLEMGKTPKHIFTKGINPFYQTESDIIFELQTALLPELNVTDVNQLFFYGAGCSFPEKKVIVSNAIGHFFKHSTLEVQSDLLGAARSLFGTNKGIACILGTGSNSCYYDGEIIVENVSPLGFILGDEGSGAVLGKQLVADCFKNQLHKELKRKFVNQYNINHAEVLENVYKMPFPNRYLAKFTPFLSENIEDSTAYNIVYNSFLAFFKRNILQYEFKSLKVGVIGSVGFHFKKTLIQVANEFKIEIEKIEQSPMEGLIKFHTENLIKKEMV